MAFDRDLRIERIDDGARVVQRFLKPQADGLAREASNAISQSEIAAIRRLPAATARSIMWRASVESSELPATSQSHTWVSSRSRSGSDVLLIPGPLRILDRLDD